MTDKTGTLTQNLMEFKCFYVDGQKFGSTLMSEDIIREEDTYRDSHSSVRSGL
jgi:P-type E1-E2 ATPase